MLQKFGDSSNSLGPDDDSAALFEAALGDSEEAFLDVVWMDVVELAREYGPLVEPTTDELRDE
jgi:hypothetical protein